MQDLLNLGLDNSTVQQQPSGVAGSIVSDPLALLDDSFGSTTPAAQPLSFPTVTVFEKDGISITFAFSKPAGQPALTDIIATFNNSGGSQITGFALQVSILPTFMHLQILEQSAALMPSIQGKDARYALSLFDA